MATVSELIGKIEIEGVDEYVSGVRRVGDETERAGDDVDGATSSMGEKVQALGTRMQGVGVAMSKWVTGPAIALGTALGMTAIKTGNWADRILDLSTITGMSTEAIQEYQHVARMAGVETEAVTRATEGLVQRLARSADGGGRAGEAMQKLGVAMHDTNGNLRDGESLMDDLIVNLAGMDDELERNIMGQQIFGGAWKDMAPILAMGTDGIAEARQEAHDLGLVMGGDALDAANETRKEWERVKAQAAALGREIGVKVGGAMKALWPVVQSKVIPAFQSLGDRLGRVIDWFANLSPRMQGVVSTIAALVIAIGPLLAAFGTFLVVLPSVVAGAGILAAAIGAISLPIVAAVAGIAALVAAGIWLWKNWDKVSAALSKAWQAIRTTATSAMQSVRQSIVNGVDNVLSTMRAFPGRAGGAIAGLARELRSRAGTAMTAFGTRIREVWGNIRDWLSGMPERAASALGDVAKAIGAKGKEAGEAFGAALRAAINAVLSRIRSIRLPSVTVGDRTIGGQSPFSGIPELASGGTARRAGLALVGEEGPEYLHMPRGASVIPLNHASGGVSRGDVTVNVTARTDASPFEIARAARRAVLTAGGV